MEDLKRKLKKELDVFYAAVNAMLKTSNDERIKILIDPGHAKTRPGANTHDKRKYEHDYTPHMAHAIKIGLEDSGHFTVDVYDPEIDDLAGIGAKAKGYDLFLSIHLNAYDRDYEDEYTCVCVHKDVGKQDSYRFASGLAREIANAIDNPLFRPSAVNPGVYPLNLSVLRAAEIGCDGPCVLSESFFIDAHDATSETYERCIEAAKAHVKYIARYFGVNG